MAAQANNATPVTIPGFARDNHSLVLNPYVAMSTTRAWTAHGYQCVPGELKGKALIFLLLFFEIFKLKKLGYNKNKCFELLVATIAHIKNRTSLDLFEMLVYINTKALSTISNYYSQLKHFMLFIYKSEQVSRTIALPRMNTKSKEDVLTAFFLFITHMSKRKSTVRGLIWEYVFERSFLREKRLHRGSILQIVSAAKFFSRIALGNPHDDTMHLDTLLFNGLNNNLMSAKKASMPFDSFRTAHEIVKNFLLSTDDTTEFLGYVLHTSLFFALRTNKAFLVTAEDFDFYNENDQYCPDIPSDISSVNLRVQNYKNQKYVDDEKVISVLSIPELDYFDPVRVIARFCITDFSQISLSSLYKLLQQRLKSFWINNTDLYEKNKDKRFSIGSFRVTTMMMMNAQNISIEDMKSLTFHRSAVLENIYLTKSRKHSQRRYAVAMKKALM